MMVGFKFKQVNYNRELLESELRHYARLLFKAFQKIEYFKNNNNKQLEYVNLIFHKAVEQSFTKKKLRKVEYHYNKFDFLPYQDSPKNTETTHFSTSYDSIHSIAYKFISLSIGAYKKLELFIDIKNVKDNEGNILEYEVSSDKSYYTLLDGEYSSALYEDVANTTRNNIQIFIHELREYGRILSFDEVSTYSAMEEMLSILEYPDDFEDETNIESSSESSETDDFSQAEQAVSNTELGNQRSSSMASDNIEETDKKSHQTTYFFTEKTESNNNPEDLEMHELLSWIYSLPEDIKKYFLNTNFIQSLISSLKKNQNIINLPNILDKFSLLFELSLEETHKYAWSYNNETYSINELKMNNEERDPSFLPDTNLIYKGDISNMVMILPIMGLESIGFESIQIENNMIGEVIIPVAF